MVCRGGRYATAKRDKIETDKESIHRLQPEMASSVQIMRFVSFCFVLIMLGNRMMVVCRV